MNLLVSIATHTVRQQGILARSFSCLTAEEEEGEDEEEEETELSPLDVFTLNPTVPEVGMAPSRGPLQPAVETVEGLCVCVRVCVYVCMCMCVCVCVCVCVCACVPLYYMVCSL